MGRLLTLFDDDGLLGRYNFRFDSRLTGLPAFMQALGFTFTRNSTKLVLQDGQYVTLAADQFGTSYDTVAGKYGYLSESAATNVLPYSYDFSNAIYTKAGVTLSDGGPSPISGVNATAVTPTATNAIHYIRPNDTTYALSSNVLTTRYWIVKSNGYRYVGIGRNVNDGNDLAVFDLNTGNRVQVSGDWGGSQSGSISLGKGWYVIYCNKSTTSASARSPRLYILGNSYTAAVNGITAAFAGDGTSGILCCHCQQETGRYPSSPIVTNGATATRAADALTCPLSNIAGFNINGFTLFSDHRGVTANATARPSIAVQGATYENSVYIGDQLTQDIFRIYPDNSIPGVNTVLAYTLYERRKLAMSAQLNNCVMSRAGATVTEDTSTGMPTSLSTLSIGGFFYGSQINGYIYRVALITRALTQAQLNAITE